MPKQNIWIALGGNLGEPLESFRSSRQMIATLPDTTLHGSAPYYRTTAVGPKGQPDYYNSVIAISSTLPAEHLLDALQTIELAHGRERLLHWGARTLDLDIIAIDQMVLQTPSLCIPHTHMFDRQFVLRPLCDIAPTWKHPLFQITAKERLMQLLQQGEKPLGKGNTW